ncbi:MAG TPA: acetate uptake transporter [Streptosporangiaceae bacterium]|nr:acetate uptake transporter [Streptosporangiaceae bacterium]
MSVSEDRTVQPATVPAPVSSLADPAPLGLAAFALTTFLLSAKNADWMSHATGSAWLGYALAYGGVAQFAAGMWEFRRGNTFGATAFSSYGAFWFGTGLWILLVVNPAVAGIAKAPATAGATVASINHDLGWIALAWAIFTLYMLIFTSQVNLAIFLTFLFLEVTFIILAIGNFDAGTALVPTGTIKIGGYLGLVTALLAWYASAAGVGAGMGGRILFPVGRPLIKARV